MKKTYRILIISGALLLCAALTLTAYNVFLSVSANKNAAKTLAEINKNLPEQKNTAETPLYELYPEMEMPIIKIEDKAYIGTINIPNLGISLPVASEWNYKDLRKTPCRYSGSAYTKNMVICAHNYAAHFGRLSSLKIGDKVIFTDADGNGFTYSVKEVETVKPTEIEKMINGDCDLTLFTCNLSGNARIAVRLTQDKKQNR